MTDPLSVSASLIAVIQLTRAVGSYLCKVRNATEESRRLLLEVTAISGLVYQLKYLADDVASGADWANITQSLLLPDGPLDQLKGALERLNSKLDTATRSRASHALRWPFNRSEVHESLDLISRLKVLFVLALQNDQMALSVSISDNVSTLVHRAAQQDAENEQRRREELRHQVIAWISPLSFNNDHADLLEAWQRWYPEARKYEPGKWLLSHELFRTWEAFQGSSILWVNGKAGSGKSVLASRVVKYFEESYLPQQKHGLGYIYCSSREISKQNPTLLASCILQQLCSQSPTLDDSIIALYQKYRDWPSTRPGRLEIEEVLLNVLSNFHQAYFVVDGLDECADQKILASLFFRIHELSSPVTKIIFFSRSARPPIEPPFRRPYSHIIIDSDLNRKDIELYTTIRLSSLSLADESIKDKIAKELLGKADGTFLWVHLQIEALLEQPDPDILTEAPRGLLEFFERSLRRTQEYSEFGKRTTAQVIFWAANAKRPLHISEMIQAIAIRSDMQLTFNIEEYCAGLVQVDKAGYVQLFHSSVQELLTSGHLSANPGTVLEEFITLQDNASSIMASVCLKTLLSNDMRNGPATTQELFEARVKQCPFYPYAVQFWAYHIRDDSRGDCKALLNEFLECPSAIASYLQAAYASQDCSRWDSYPRNRTALHVVANFGLFETLETLPDAKRMVKQRDSWGWKAIDLALSNGRRKCSLHLLSLETFINEKTMNEYPLHKAIEFEWPDVIERLLHMRADLDRRYTNSYTPLHRASRHCDRADVLHLLLDAGADIESRTQDQATALMLAAEAGNTPVAEALIKAGADVNAKNQLGQNVFHYAARSSSTTIIEVLKRAGSSPAVFDVANDTPLHFAAKGVHTDVVNALIEAGGDVNAVNIVGNSPLHVAAAWGRNEIVLLLVKHGADPFLGDRFYWNAIHILAFMKNLSLIEKFQPSILPPSVDNDQEALTRLISSIETPGFSPITRTLAWTSNTPFFFYALQPDSSLLLSYISSTDHAHPNTTDRHGVSFLHIACAANLPPIVSALISQGADVNLKDQWGRTPYSLAIGSAGSEVRSLLAQESSFAAPKGPDPAKLEVKNCWLLQHLDRNFVLYVRCNECGALVDGTYVHCTLCVNDNLKTGYDLCLSCVVDRQMLTCRTGHGCRDLQVIQLRDHMLSFVEEAACVHDLVQEPAPEQEQENTEDNISQDWHEAFSSRSDNTRDICNGLGSGQNARPEVLLHG